MDTQTNKKVVVLITRYNEYIDWIRYIIHCVDYIYIYNKGTNDNLFNFIDKTLYKDKLRIINLPNIGRIDHTLTYHILQHWDNLPEILVSLPGSIMMSEKKGYYLNSIIKRIPVIKEKFSGFFGPRFYKVSPKFNYNIDNYQAKGACNKNDNPFIKSKYKDFVEWKLKLIDNVPMTSVVMRCTFAVCKENIQFIDKQIYKNILESLSVGDNIENGHFVERIWGHLFTQLSLCNQVISQKSDTLLLA